MRLVVFQVPVPLSDQPASNSQIPAQAETDDATAKGFWRRELPLEAETCMFILVNALDVFMTYVLLNLEGFHESNMLADYFLDRWGLKGMVYYKFLLVGVVSVIAQIIAPKRLRTARYLLNFGSAIVMWVVIYSGYLFYQHSGLF